VEQLDALLLQEAPLCLAKFGESQFRISGSRSSWHGLGRRRMADRSILAGPEELRNRSSKGRGLGGDVAPEEAN